METLDHGGYSQNVTTPKKNFAKELFADMITYYVRNAKSLSQDEREDFTQLDNATNAQQLVKWAANIHITGTMGDMTSIELANIIRTSDEKTLNGLLQDALTNQRIIKEKMMAMSKQANEIRNNSPETNVILFQNGENNYTAFGKSAKQIAEKLAIIPDNIINDIPIVNVNNSGIILLEKNNTPFHIAKPITSISFINDQQNELAKENRLLMQMGHLAVLSKGDTVRFQTDGQIFGNEKTIELKNGLFMATFVSDTNNTELKSIPLQLFNTRDGQGESYLSNLNAQQLQNLRIFFNDHFDSLKQTTVNYAFNRKALDENLQTLIGQNDRLSKENPDTIILFKQRGFIEAFSDSAINAANTLGLSLYNRSDHKGKITIPFTKMTVDDYKKLYDTDNNVYLAKPTAQDKLTDANLTKVNAYNMPLSQGNQQKKEERRSLKR